MAKVVNSLVVGANNLLIVTDQGDIFVFQYVGRPGTGVLEINGGYYAFVAVSVPQRES